SHRGGVGRVLMTQLHEHADRHRLRLVLDVLPTRTHVIALYEDLGYRSTPSGSTAAPLVVMERIGVPRGG
ncbi:MAG TPA: GNAT family N-acetyltransferase, partial [Mycobacteriales bacterium]|nr:GNAT family N-acetyltransferase [Mycobacteriales bacterium]